MAARKAADEAAATSAAESFPVAEGEDPWTPEEIAEVRAELMAEHERMSNALHVAEAGLQDLLLDASDGAGRDPADVGSSNFERDQEMSLAANAREMLDQVELALHRIDTGQYGLCESCGKPIGKGRLQVFPRATMCVACKLREERR
ncbi:TraR/DksA family transcriptional regulator [Propionicicella superfundia]|uniref:TraR/DksA family transcriptional regulator n=1 Tax=Propionicicella superfundia TaxID=348582 RepID=UPI00040C869A|nr:TraR/DksA family transcriptional regulator [Propionicicella superfundia]